MKATGFITLLFALGFLLPRIAFSDVPEPCYLFDPDSTFSGPDYGGIVDDSLCPGATVMYEFYYRNHANGDHEVQITRIWVDPPDADCSFNDLYEIALRDYFQDDPKNLFKANDDCISTLMSSISSCMKEAIDTGPPEVPDHFPAVETQMRKFKNETSDSLDPVWYTVFFPCTDSTCCYAYYTVCWDSNGVLTSMEIWGAPSAQGGCNVEEGCDPRCSALDITFPDEEKINSAEEFIGTRDFVVSPNPNSGEFSLQILKSGAYELFIYNSIGDIIYHKSMVIDDPDLSIIFKLYDRPQGIYFIRLLESGKPVFEESIILKK